jgi:Zn finger protein HypA/HybF involved in hydrogenase expression
LNIQKTAQVRKSLITISCNKCGFTQNTNIENLIVRKTGCTACQSGNAKIKDNPTLLFKALNEKELTLRSELPNNQLDKILVACNKCKTDFYVIPVKLMHPQTDNTSTCPNCRSTDRRVVYNNELFGSQIERDVYIELTKYIPNIERQVRYSSLASCSRKWVMDMLIGKTIIEVSNFAKKPHNNSYYSNLKEKKSWAEDNGFIFIHISKISEVKTLVKDIVWSTS